MTKIQKNTKKKIRKKYEKKRTRRKPEEKWCKDSRYTYMNTKQQPSHREIPSCRKTQKTPNQQARKNISEEPLNPYRPRETTLT
jgi:hypothetical protein